MDLHEQNMHKLSFILRYMLTNYDENKNVKVVYKQRQHYGNFRRSLEKQTKLKLNCRDWKDPIVTFFSGGRRAFIGESRIPKKKIQKATTAFEMSAFELTDAFNPFEKEQ
jgi:bisphosphoglycerate-independent phosphoglycerate mutase (AlkP superfamily)